MSAINRYSIAPDPPAQKLVGRSISGNQRTDATKHSPNRKRPKERSFTSTITDPLIDHSFTFHEYLCPFIIIEMNGRAYDPLVGRFLSADPYIQAPDNTQNLNRYSYCLNNPLRYSDPSGEFLIEAMIIGGLANWIMSGCEFNSDGLFSFAIGLPAGAAGFGVGQVVSKVAGIVGFAAGAVTGASAGFVGGFVAGAGNAWINGANFGQGLGQGFIGGGIGALTGGLIGGLRGGEIAKALGFMYWSGTGVGMPVEMSAKHPLPYDPGKPTGILNSDQLTEHAHSNYPGPDEYVQGVLLGTEGNKSNPFVRMGYTVENGQLYNSVGEPIYGANIPFRESVFGGVKSMEIISTNMVSFSNHLDAVLGHELIHANHVYTGFMATYGSEASEYYTSRYSASVPHASQLEEAAVARGIQTGIPLSHYFVYPSWVPSF